MKKNIEKKEAYIEIIKNLLNKCADELNNNKTILKTIIDLIKDAAAITNNPSLKDSGVCCGLKNPCNIIF